MQFPNPNSATRRCVLEDIHINIGMCYNCRSNVNVFHKALPYYNVLLGHNLSRDVKKDYRPRIWTYGNGETAK